MNDPEIGSPTGHKRNSSIELMEEMDKKITDKNIERIQVALASRLLVKGASRSQSGNTASATEMASL